eukprot:CAMPEP_0172299580 /NCGR_PEP_ID=MMETSP1058-20130122/1852_1 /TAXON_ID=83371 /ORGANISM="Detonula confervacea, Strain CCMP 353" /LENGTH=371 /DNA_ID=CAMNT_0013009081 /DNA_START=107 /DNA_END=1222 /DNA_ORIENTATION=-
MGAKVLCGFCLGITVLLLVLILVPLSFSYVDYYDYGLVQRKSTGSVDKTEVYSNGRYAIGADKHFIKYQADAHLESFDELGVFSATTSNVSIGLAFDVDIDFTYLLIKEEIGEIHNEMASNYRSVIRSRAEEAIKNIAAKQVTFTDFFQQRQTVEALFRSAVEERWNSPPSLHCTMDQFHLGRIRIPQSVATKQLESRVQNERNDKEEFLQQAQLERELTTVEVNQVDLKTNLELTTARAKASQIKTKAVAEAQTMVQSERNEKEEFLQQAQLERELTTVEVNQVNLKTKNELRTATAQASLVRAKAHAEAQFINSQARINGTQMLLKAVGIETQDHKTAFTYIKTLMDRGQLSMAVSYLSEDSVVRTAPV